MNHAKKFIIYMPAKAGRWELVCMEKKSNFSKRKRRIAGSIVSYILVFAMVLTNVQPALSTVYAAEYETELTSEADQEEVSVEAEESSEAPTPSETQTSSETTKPSETEAASETVKPEETSETAKPGETESTNETAKPSETESTSETIKPGETEEPSETIKPSETEVASETVKPSETEESSETAKPSETEETTETVKPTETETATETTQTTETETEAVTETETEQITANAEETVTVKAHFKNVLGWDSVAIHHWGGDISDTTWPGEEIKEKDSDGYYVVEISGVSRTAKLGMLFDNNQAENTSKTADIEIDAAEIAGDTYELWIWQDATGKPVVSTTPIQIVSPEIEKNTVTFRYINDWAESVLVAGTMNGWAGDPTKPGAIQMVKGEDGIFTYTTKMQRGEYEYKFVVTGQGEDGSKTEWTIDPCNDRKVDNGNNAFTIDSLLSPEIKEYDATFYFEYDSEETVLVSGSMNGWNKNPEAENAAIMTRITDGPFKGLLTYTYSDLPPGDYEYKFHVPAKGDDGWFADPNNELKAGGDYGNSLFTIGEDDSKVYEYTIHYYNPAVKQPVLEEPALLIWNGNATSSSGKQHPFQEMLDDEENGIQWLTLSVKVPYKKIGMNGKPKADKNKKDTDRTYAITSGEDTAELWYVYGKGIYDKKPVFGRVKKVDVSLSSPTMNYTENNVLTLELSGEDDVEVTGNIREAYVDASALGMSSKMNIDPELLAVTLSVRESVVAGTYTLPVTVIDFYDTKIETSIDVEVVNKTDGSFDWDEAVIYFMVTDRFYDGNSKNNDANGAGTYGDNDGLYHGGDFAGVTEKLDYLKELGINTIWITPIVDNIEGVDVDDGKGPVPFNAAYHGYWASDFTKLDPALGTEDEFRTLISEAHSKGIKIMVDVVLNHAGYGMEDYFNKLLKDEEGNAIQMIRDESQQVSGSEQQASLSGLPDFLTENEEVRNQLVKWQVDWMKNYDIDYFRVDTVKHVESTTWNAFKNALTKENPKFKMIGEYYGAGHSWNGGSLGSGQMDSVLDFNFNEYATDFVKGNIASVENNLRDRNKTLNNTYMTGQFLSSHDEVGFKQNLLDQKWEQDAADAAALVAATLQITAKGQPVIYYGEEVGQTGENNYPYQTNRYDFNWEAGKNNVYNHYNTLLQIRNQYAALFAKGDRQSVALSNADGYDVVSRSYNGETIYIGMNIKSEAQTITIPVNSNGISAYEDLYSRIKDSEDTVYEITNGRIEITIPAAADGGTVVLVPSSFKEGLLAPELKLIKGKEISLPAQLVNMAEDGTRTKVDVTYTTEASAGVTLDNAKNTILVDETFEGSIITLTAVSDSGKVTFNSKVYVDNNKITLKIHYHREDGEYEGWNVWGWKTGADGKGYEFEEVGDDRIVTIEIDDARANCDYNYIVRKRVGDNDWADKNDQSDQKIDLSDVLSGTVHFYIEGGKPGGTRVLDDDTLTGAKVLSADFDSENGHIIVTTSVSVEGNAQDIFKLITSGEELDLKRVIAKDNIYELITVEDLTTMEAKAKTYSLLFDGFEYNVRMPSAYSSDEFEEEYTYDGDDLGATWTRNETTFKVWAPTADSVQVKLYASGTEGTDDCIGTLDMEKGEKGVWSAVKAGDQNGVYYTYSVTIGQKIREACDPYAVTTGVNGNRAMVLNLDATDPTGWDQDQGSTDGMSYTDSVIYEMHVRDFSIDPSSGIKNKGKFLGLTEKGTKNITGQTTGLDYLVDLGVTHLHLLPSYDYATVDETKLDTAQYNWGYDPKNYNVPEGSYSTNPYKGDVRVKEMKQMVKTLHDNNINVIMDVVYNHVYSADEFCFNQIVPQYFSRTNEDGSYSNGSGCGNDTASERSMVKKYIVDSVNYWADEYHIDGFRFDLVGLIDTETINEVVNTVHEKHPNVIFYGEGWDMTTTVSKDGYTMTTQKNSAQTPEFAFFSDTIRDLLKGSVFDAMSIGFISGQQGKEEDVAKSFKAVPGWTSNPTQIINYASCHDNYTLKDKLNVSRADASEQDRIKMNNLAAAIYMMSEGIPLIHAGEEILRTKVDEQGNVIHNSYNSSDYVNRIKWFDLGRSEYRDVRDYYKGLIAFRKNHAALRLTSASDIEKNVKSYVLPNNAVMFVINGKQSIKDEASDGIIVIFNADTAAREINLFDEAYGIANGNWYICIDDQNAGTEAIGYAEDGKVTVAPISAMVLVNDGKMIGNAKEALNNLIADCEKVEKGEYTDDTWNIFQDALAAAKGISGKEDASEGEIINAKNSLKNALDNLRTPSSSDDDSDELLTQSKKSLNDLIAECEKVEKGDYSDDSWKSFQSELESAKNIVAKEDATVDEINIAWQNLSDARAKLRVPSSSGDDNNDNNDNDLLEQSRKNLTDLIVECEKIEKGDYTDDSWNNFQKVLASAKEIAAKQDASMDEFNKAWDALSGARGGLKKPEVHTGIYVGWAEGSGLSEYHVTYTGQAHKPTVVVYDGAKLLREKQDYTVSYKDNINAGKAAVLVKGKGNYAETVEKNFTIDKVKISTLTIANLSAAVAANNTKQVALKPVIQYEGKTLSQGRDYTAAYKNPGSDGRKPGVYSVIIKGAGNFEGDQTIQMILADKSTQVLMSKVKVQKIAVQPYKNGDKVEPTVRVSYKGSTLNAGTDYTVAYANNTEAGATASVIISGTGTKYVGDKVVTFKINGIPLKASAVSLQGMSNGGFAYTGAAVEPKVQVSGLSADQYSVSYQNNWNVGKATVVVTGRKGYSGTVKKTFKITPYDISGSQFTFGTNRVITNKIPYAKGGATLGSSDLNARFTANGRTIQLEEGVDYTLSYKKNKTIGTATATIKGKGNFKGTVKNVSFVVEQQDMSRLQKNVIAPDVLAKNAAKYNKVVPVILDTDGKTLKNNKDFTIKGYSYQDDSAVSGTPAAGKVLKVTVQGKGYYKGETYGYFRVIANDRSIAKAVVKVNDQQYTGKPVEPDKKQITSITLKVNGQTRTLGQNDYEIVGYSKNIKKGTAKMTIRGLGEYGGTKTVSFKITAKKLK